MPTIGVALAVPEPWGRQLQEFRVSLGDELAAGIPTHITLVPPTEVPDDDAELVHRHLAAVADVLPPFSVHLRGTGTFRPVSPVVFLAVARGISGCEQLAGAVRRGPLEAELRFPYHPHVTIAHDVDEPALDLAYEKFADFECEFAAGAFHLYVHAEGTGWRPVRSYALTGGAVDGA